MSPEPGLSSCPLLEMADSDSICCQHRVGLSIPREREHNHYREQAGLLYSQEVLCLFTGEVAALQLPQAPLQLPGVVIVEVAQQLLPQALQHRLEAAQLPQQHLLQHRSEAAQQLPLQALRQLLVGALQPQQPVLLLHADDQRPADLFLNTPHCHSTITFFTLLSSSLM